MRQGSVGSIIFLALFLTGWPFSIAQAAVQWSLAVSSGIYTPSLDALNRVVTNPQVELGPRKTDARPVPYAVITQGTHPAMPEMSPNSPKFGLQVQAELNPRYAVVFGNSIEVVESGARDIHPFFVGFYIDARRETRFSLTLNQVWVGVRRYIRPSPRLYGEMGVIGITRADLSTDVWLHVFAPEEGFDFYKVASTGARGSGEAAYFGLGGEYNLRKQVALSLDLQYVVGGISNIRFTRFFTVDPLEEGLIRPGDTVTVTDFAAGRREPLFLKLDGWDLKGAIRFLF